MKTQGLRFDNVKISAACNVAALRYAGDDSLSGIVRVCGRSDSYRFRGICVPFSAVPFTSPPQIDREARFFYGSEKEFLANYNGETKAREALKQAQMTAFSYRIPVGLMGLNDVRQHAIDLLTGIIEKHLPQWLASVNEISLTGKSNNASRIFYSRIVDFPSDFRQAAKNHGMYFHCVHQASNTREERCLGQTAVMISTPFGGQPKK